MHYSLSDHLYCSKDCIIETFGTSFERRIKMSKTNLPDFSDVKIPKKTVRMLGIMVLIILILAALSRTLGGAETLADYAEKHPEQQIRTETEAADSK